MDIKHEVLQSWERRASRARDKVEELKIDLAYQSYELEITQRVLAKAQNDSERETWQIQVDVLSMIVGQTEEEIEKEAEDIALCAAMLAELEADLAAG